MTKQEEIGLVLYSLRIGQITEDIAMKQLDKLGLVLKVARDFPKKDVGQDNIQYCAGWYDCFHEAVEAGYEAVESLVSE